MIPSLNQHPSNHHQSSLKEIISSCRARSSTSRSIAFLLTTHLSKNIFQFLYLITAMLHHMLHTSLLHLYLMQLLLHLVISSFLVLVTLLHLLHQIFQYRHRRLQKLVVHARYLLIQNLHIPLKSTLLPLQISHILPPTFQDLLHRSSTYLTVSNSGNEVLR